MVLCYNNSDKNLKVVVFMESDGSSHIQVKEEVKKCEEDDTPIGYDFL